MKLMEFFGKPVDIEKEMSKERGDNGIGNDLFWFIIDHDKLHKDHFHDIAKKIHRQYKSKSVNKEEIVKDFLPMVKKGCMEFYTHHKLPGRPGNHFDKELIKDLCERLFDHYKDDIIHGKYKIGQ